MLNKIIGISNELKVCRFGSGIKLIRQEKLNNQRYIQSAHDENTIGCILKHPFSVYLETTQHVIIKSNEITAEACGFASLDDFIGKPAFRFFKKDTIEKKIANHKQVIRNDALVIAEENALLQDGSEVNTLSVRMPWYNDENKIIGLFGCSIVLGKNPLAESLTKITKLGLLNLDQLQNKSNFAGLKVNSSNLSKRELECLRLTIKGKPAKQVAYELKISQRTVEEYLENIKRKMRVTSKSALIEKGIDYFVG
ncbi:MAG: LuxR family transcriptional regulator [Gammaproteobacteria bacterium]|jgi:DNA-binding CsgD family transcriptional regulator|nr:LuxR family transcriptional regulator [Gammaproteobacteria bacterium]